MLNENDLIIGEVVGYMLKAMKNKIDIRYFQKEFSSIRHGNYDRFLELINEERPHMWEIDLAIDKIRKDDFSQENTSDFGMICQSGPSLKKFYKECKIKYGKLDDSDITDDIYYKLAVFEISIRMISNNYGLSAKDDNLKTIINKLSSHMRIVESDVDKLHQGRKFLNFIKHNNNKFKSYSDGIIQFNKAYDILNTNNIKII